MREKVEAIKKKKPPANTKSYIGFTIFTILTQDVAMLPYNYRGYAIFFHIIIVYNLGPFINYTMTLISHIQ